MKSLMTGKVVFFAFAGILLSGCPLKESKTDRDSSTAISTEVDTNLHGQKGLLGFGEFSLAIQKLNIDPNPWELLGIQEFCTAYNNPEPYYQSTLEALADTNVSNDFKHKYIFAMQKLSDSAYFTLASTVASLFKKGIIDEASVSFVMCPGLFANPYRMPLNWQNNQVREIIKSLLNTNKLTPTFKEFLLAIHNGKVANGLKEREKNHFPVDSFELKHGCPER